MKNIDEAERFGIRSRIADFSYVRGRKPVRLHGGGGQ